MKTPDEIKKGLEYLSIKDVARKLDAWDEGVPYDYVEDAAADALALIQQLKADKQQLEGLLTHMNQLRDAAAGRALSMEERVHQLEAERDAAVEALTKIVQKHDESFCEYCNNWDRYTCPSSCRTHCERFNWRGVQKEETK